MKEETSKPNLSIRAAEAEDEPFLEALYADTRREELALIGWSREQEDAFFKMQFQMQARAYQMQFSDTDYHIVELDGEPVGRMIVLRGEKEIRLVDISLLTEFRNRGIGSVFLEQLKAETAGSSRVLSLRVLKTNTGAKRLYERLGFEVVEETDLHFTMQWCNF
jgi:ribosomal protein S18 acetylase RimI-like enzyme